MATIFSFPPLLAPRARVLVLGSMPGERSLAAGQYYAHPANSFWPILGAYCGFDAALPYEDRTARIAAAGIAVWDVLQTCQREGSLDTSIVRATMRTNDFVGFFAQHAAVRTVLCNGGTAHTMFATEVVPAMGAAAAGLRVVRLPSTSPAHAGVRPAEKQAVWHRALAEALA